MYQRNQDFPETMVNFLFRDLTSSQQDKKLVTLLKALAKDEMGQFKNIVDFSKGSMCARIFNEMVKTNEVKKYLVFLFKSKFEKIDFNYLDHVDLFEIFKYESDPLINFC